VTQGKGEACQPRRRPSRALCTTKLSGVRCSLKTLTRYNRTLIHRPERCSSDCVCADEGDVGCSHDGPALLSRQQQNLGCCLYNERAHARACAPPRAGHLLADARVRPLAHERCLPVMTLGGGLARRSFTNRTLCSAAATMEPLSYLLELMQACRRQNSEVPTGPTGGTRSRHQF